MILLFKCNVIFAICDFLDQRCLVKFCVKLWKTFQNLKLGFGDDALVRTQYYQLFSRFNSVDQLIENNPQPERF